MKAKHQKQAGERLKLWQQRLALSNAAYSAEYARMDQRERIYNGDHQLRPLVPGDTRRDGGVRSTSHVRNIVFENVETQVSSAIPQPKVTPRRREDEGLAQLLEHFLRNELERLPFAQLNDLAERTVPIQGGVAYLVEWDNRERIDASYPVKAYLLTLARNRALNHLKHKRVQEDNEQEIAAWMEHVAEDWRTIESQEERLRVKMGELSEKQREAIVKCVVEGKRYQAAADEMGISVNSLKTHLARGLSFLRAELTNAEDDDAQRDMMALLVFAWKS